jgi:hypothetical protein
MSFNNEKEGKAYLDARVEDSNGEQSTRHDLVICRVEVLVNLGQATLNIPQGHHADAGGGAHLAVFLVLKDPVHVGGQRGGGGGGRVGL